MTIRSLFSRIAAAAAITAGGGVAADPQAPVAEHGDAGADGGHRLAYELTELSPLAATHTACELALSADREQRLAVASALAWTFHLVGDDLVIDHLASDPDPRIRRAAARAAWARRAIGGDPGVLARLADDPDPFVREVAALAEPRR
jgi:hypothetical protein